METGNRKNSKSAPSAKKGSTAAPVKVIDWAGVEQAYCNTRQSTREIGKAFGISHTMVAKHAAAKGWDRPSKDQISNPTPKKGRAELEPRKQRFVDEYLVDLNGTQAYMRAYGCSEKSARTNAARLLANAGVQAAIAAGRAKTADKLGLTRERVLDEYAKLAFFDMRQAYHDSGALKLPHELDEDTAAAIAGYETVEMDGGGKDAPPLMVRKVKWSDRKAALDSIMKAQGWNKSDVGTADNPLVIRDMSDAERAVRISAALQAHPGLAALFAQFVPGGARQ